MLRVTGGWLGLLLGAVVAVAPAAVPPSGPPAPVPASPTPMIDRWMAPSETMAPVEPVDPARTAAPAEAVPPVPSAQTPRTPAGEAHRAARWSWPLDPRPSVARRFDPPAQRWLAGHRGVDLQASSGATVLAAADGVVAFAGSVAGKGVVSIDHPTGLRSTYEPVRALVTAGQAVRRGQDLGVLVTEGSHCLPRACLHWGARRGSDYVDPLALVGAGPVILLPLR